MVELALATIALVAIITVSLRVENTVKKLGSFMGIGLAAVAYLWTQGEIGRHVVHEVFAVDYVQFIPIPVATVLIACLGLIALDVQKGARLGWFLFLACPFIGNVGTTWALVPAGLSLAVVLQRVYPDRWFRILIAVCAFSMNFLALGTLAADPPQAYWAVKSATEGRPFSFFFPLGQFWPYIGITMCVYYVTLRRFGVGFGNPTNLLLVRPASWPKFLFGLVIAGCVIAAVTLFRGYGVTAFLGTICMLVALSSLAFGHHERHATVHWVAETMTVFVAFFGVVALAHAGLHHLHIENQVMTGVVVIMTLFADNAAAFAAGYPQFHPRSQEYQVWYNLFNAVTYGGISPLGNGPQIALFLIIFVNRKMTTPGEVFVTWFKEACVFMPYLLVWTLGMTCLIELGFRPTPAIQLLVGIVAMTTCFQCMDLERLFRPYVDEVNGDDVPAPETEVAPEETADAMA